MTNNKKMKLVLENGQEFCGLCVGAQSPAVGEIVFNTSVVGYQEIISDPAYAGQIVVMTYPLIGQYGITAEDFESRATGVAGLVVGECCETPSNFRFTKTLSEELEERGVPCLTGLDTRMVTRLIRGKGAIRAAIVDESMALSDALRLISLSPVRTNVVPEVSCSKRWFSRTAHHNYDVVIIDCGMKHSIVSALNKRGCNVTVVPFDSTVQEIMAFNPDGILISNGPGAPEELPGIIELVKELRSKLPIYGICLGQQIIALSYGAKTYRMASGHHGGHPVRNMETGRIISAEHNHNFAIDPISIEGTGLSVTYRDVADGCIEGIACPADKVSAVQFYPEGCPGPEESDFFDKFIKDMED